MDERLRKAEAALEKAQVELCEARRGVSEDPWKEVPCQEMVKRCIGVASVKGRAYLKGECGPNGGKVMRED